ncbi:MAG: mitochondrial fission ELM1 family protein [Sedimenticola sp.]
MVVWRILDGKPGHENQTLGLVSALKRIVPQTDVFDIRSESGPIAAFHWLTGRVPATDALPVADLIVGAGHATHLTMLACRKARGGRAVVLMNPSLPSGLFDLCVIPAHDGVAEGEGVFVSRGALNPLSPEGEHDPGRGLFLVGGPSRHHGWDGDRLVNQIAEIAQASPDVEFTLTTSRRTPDDFLPTLGKAAIANLDVVPVDETAPGWVADRLAESATAWVTEDSVSMVYEALTAGVSVGLLPAPMTSESRVSRGLKQLADEGLVLPFGDWKGGKSLESGKAPLSESLRCAEWIVEKWHLDS